VEIAQIGLVVLLVPAKSFLRHGRGRHDWGTEGREILPAEHGAVHIEHDANRPDRVGGVVLNRLGRLRAGD